VVHLPPLQRAFGTVGLSARDWASCAAVASSVLRISEPRRAITRMLKGKEARPDTLIAWSR
jgi:hypothetical protein